MQPQRGGARGQLFRYLFFHRMGKVLPVRPVQKQFGGGIHAHAVNLFARRLAGGIERAHRFDLVAEKFDTAAVVVAHAPHVQNVAAHGKRAALGDLFATLVAQPRKLGRQRAEVARVARAQRYNARRNIRPPRKKFAERGGGGHQYVGLASHKRYGRPQTPVVVFHRAAHGARQRIVLLGQKRNAQAERLELLLRGARHGDVGAYVHETPQTRRRDRAIVSAHAENRNGVAVPYAVEYFFEFALRP